MTKFTAGENFNLSIYSVSGQLILENEIQSGYKSEWNVDEAGIYICRLMNASGLMMSKKVVLR